MRLFADECCKRSIVEALRAEGHDVNWAAEGASGAGVVLARMPGPANAAAARLERLIALSADRIEGHLVVVTAAKIRFRPIRPAARA